MDQSYLNLRKQSSKKIKGVPVMSNSMLLISKQPIKQVQYQNHYIPQTVKVQSKSQTQLPINHGVKIKKHLKIVDLEKDQLWQNSLDGQAYQSVPNNSVSSSRKQISLQTIIDQEKTEISDIEEVVFTVKKVQKQQQPQIPIKYPKQVQTIMKVPQKQQQPQIPIRQQVQTIRREEVEIGTIKQELQQVPFKPQLGKQQLQALRKFVINQAKEYFTLSFQSKNYHYSIDSSQFFMKNIEGYQLRCGYQLNYEIRQMSLRQFKDQFKLLVASWENDKRKSYQNSVKVRFENLPNELCNKIRILDLSQQKLTAQSMETFTKVDLQVVESINLCKNMIEDKGLQILSKSGLEKLQSIQLNDNRITIVGVAHLLNNNWKKDAVYKIDTVISRDKGFIYKVGESIATIKNILDQKPQTFSKVVDQLAEVMPLQLYHSIDLLMQIPLNGKPIQITKQSDEIQKQLIQDKKMNPISLSNAICSMKNSLLGADVIFTKKSNIKSQLSCKILFGCLQQKRIRFQHRIVSKEWNFSDFKDNNEKLMEYQQWYKNYLAKQYGANYEDIVIHKVTEGSTITHASVDHSNPLVGNNNFLRKQQVTVTPFFKTFNLTPDDFDPDGNCSFPNNKQSELQVRGGIPYFQPICGVRFGVKVIGLYDNGKNNWLSMNGVAGQWAVAFHGINYPEKIVFSNNQKKSILQAIMSGRTSGEMLKAGARQLYAQDNCPKTGKLVGRGIYCSPYFTTCLNGYTQSVTKDNQTYRVLLQARIKPESLKCTPEAQYWVINESRDIRPYGIVLFTPQQFKTISAYNNGCNLIYKTSPNIQTHKEPCHWDSFRDAYINFRKKHNLAFP